jgi:hypothetical protein
LVSALAFANSQQTFYVGVTFDGETADEAKQLIDRVKDYTNLFVVASGSLQHRSHADELEALCDYAVEAGLDVIVYFGSYYHQRNNTISFINKAQERWGSHFLGVYYGDEPGGKALDSQSISLGNITRGADGVTRLDFKNDTFTISTYFSRSGRIMVGTYDSSQATPNHYINTHTIYFTNGTIEHQSVINIHDFIKQESEHIQTTYVYQPDGSVQDENGTAVTDQGDITQFEPYQQLWDSRPLQAYDEAATAYVASQQETLSQIRDQSTVNIFTSDYALHWWDYQGGYDVVLAHLGWNNTVAQEIGLARGAANIHGKSWGTILTWKYTEPPYLADGEEIYSQMRTSYECGAEYVVLFNYAENMTGPYGTLQEEHFEALERFWNEVVQNPMVLHGGIYADAALVLPSGYGWGLRSSDDTIWGWWRPDDESLQIWTQLQKSLAEYGSRLDIVYNDPHYPATGKYHHICYCNQTR